MICRRGLTDSEKDWTSRRWGEYLDIVGLKGGQEKGGLFAWSDVWSVGQHNTALPAENRIDSIQRLIDCLDMKPRWGFYSTAAQSTTNNIQKKKPHVPAQEKGACASVDVNVNVSVRTRQDMI